MSLWWDQLGQDVSNKQMSLGSMVPQDWASAAPRASGVWFHSTTAPGTGEFLGHTSANAVWESLWVGVRPSRLFSHGTGPLKPCECLPGVAGETHKWTDDHCKKTAQTITRNSHTTSYGSLEYDKGDRHLFTWVLCHYTNFYGGTMAITVLCPCYKEVES